MVTIPCGLSWGDVSLLVRRSQSESGIVVGRPSVPTIHEVRLRHEDDLLALPGVVGVADAMIGGHAVIRVLMSDDSTEYKAAIPAVIEGYPVEIVSTGQIDAL